MYGSLRIFKTYFQKKSYIKIFSDSQLRVQITDEIIVNNIFKNIWLLCAKKRNLNICSTYSENVIAISYKSEKSMLNPAIF